METTHTQDEGIRVTSDPPPEFPEFPDVLNKHAELFWKAEEANAARIAAKNNLILAGIVAVIGLKLHQFGVGLDLVGTCTSTILRYLFWVLVLVGLGLFACALWVALELKKYQKGQGSHASCGLMLSELVVEAPWTYPANLLHFHAFRKTYTAAIELQERNDNRRKKVDRAQQLFFVGVVCAVLAVAVYVGICRYFQPPSTPIESLPTCGMIGDCESAHDAGAPLAW